MRGRGYFLLVWWILLACRQGVEALPTPAPAPPPPAVVAVPPAAPDHDTLRATWRTTLQRKGPAPGKGMPLAALPGARLLRYPSPVGELDGWLLLPGMDGARMPVVVFAHAGHHLRREAVDDVVPLLQAGLAVWLPTFRGQNGNPGSFEMYAGEVDDLEAAVRFVASRPEVDGRRVYVLGHGAGGQLAALLALRPGLPVRGTASVGALYRTEDFLYWRDIVPFDLDDPLEVRMRLLYPNLASLKLGHIAYVGDDDLVSGKSVAAFDQEARRLQARLRVQPVKGDDTTALGPALVNFASVARAGDDGAFERQ